MDLFSRVSGYVMKASVGGLNLSFSQGVTHILAKGYEMVWSHLSHSLISALRFPASIFSPQGVN